MKTKILILVFGFSIYVYAQAQFQVSIGGINHDLVNSIIQTTDGGFAAAGYTYSFAAGYEDMYIVKLNSSGFLQWSRSVGGSGNDVANSIIQTTDGGYAVAGWSNSFGSDYSDYYFVKLDSEGMLQWNRTINRTNYDYGISVIQTSDGGFVFAGVSSTGGVFTSDIYIVKLDSSGTYQWSKTYGGSADEVAYSIIQTTDGGLVAAGYTDSFGSSGNDFYILKLDGSGNLQWSKTVGGSGTGSEVVYSIVQTTDGGFALAGETQSFGAGSYDMYVVKLDAVGSLIWTRTFGGTSEDHGWSIVQTSDGGFAIGGYTTSFGAANFYMVRLNGSGTLQWSKTYGGSSIEEAYSLRKTAGGGFVMAGETTSFGAGGKDIYIVKIDSLGNSCGNTYIPASISGTGGTLGNPNTTVITQNPTVTSPNYVLGTGGTLTTICYVSIQPISSEVPTQFSLSQNYPNPFNPKSNIKFQIAKSGDVKLVIFDVLGREAAILVNEKLNPGTYEVAWDAGSYPSGVYFYKLFTHDYSKTRKMVLLK
jgi:hypothetical protein